MTQNRGYKVEEFFPNFFFIGTDGGGEAYAFDISGDDATVFDVPFIGMPAMRAPLRTRLMHCWTTPNSQARRQ